MSLPVKRSLAVLIRNRATFLSTRRPDDDDELPGIWGLPAGSYRGSETAEELISRIGRDKLGTRLKAIRKLAHGTQARTTYILDMDLWEAEMDELPQQGAWQWATAELLKPGELQGSLCCQLARDVLKS